MGQRRSALLDRQRVFRSGPHLRGVKHP